ncbi:MAG: nitrogenase component 1 [bacterium]
MKPPSEALEAFALRAHHYGRISGVSVAVHAIADGFHLLHTGVGCKYKAAAQISTHDWARQPHRREGWTEVGDAALIRGAAARIGPYVRSWYDRQRPGLIVVSSTAFLEMTGEDIAGAVRQADETVPCPVRYVPGSGFDGDLYDGYRDVLRTVLDLIPWDQTEPEHGRVAVVGYLFDRYESDHSANVHQLRTLLRELGLNLEAVLFGGQPLASLMRAARAETLVVLPYAYGLESALRATGRRVIHTDLPVGVRGTTAWLEQVGRTSGVPETKVADVTRRLARYTRQELELLRNRVVGVRSAVFAEAPLAAGFCDLLDEVDMPPALVGIRGRSLGDDADLAAALTRIGAPLRPDATVLTDPSYRLVRRALLDAIATRRVSAAVGSAAELSDLSQGKVRERLRDHLDASGIGGDLGAGQDIRFAPLIACFPATGFHALHPQPTFGFGGAVAIAQRLLDGLYSGRS